MCILKLICSVCNADELKVGKESSLKSLNENQHQDPQTPTISVHSLFDELRKIDKELDEMLQDPNIEKEILKHFFQLREIIVDSLREYGKEQNEEFLKLFDKAEKANLEYRKKRFNKNLSMIME